MAERMAKVLRQRLASSVHGYSVLTRSDGEAALRNCSGTGHVAAPQLSQSLTDLASL